MRTILACLLLLCALPAGADRRAALASQKRIVGGVSCTGPASVAGCICWLKADALGLSNNDPVGTWTDSSGCGNSPTQSGSGDKPLFKTGQLDSLPAVQFISDDWLEFPANAFSSLTAGEIFAIVKATSYPGAAPNYNGIWEFGTAGSSDHWPDDFFDFFMGWGTDTRKYVGSAVFNVTAWHELNISSEADSWILRINDGEQVNTGSNTAAWTTAAVIGNGGGLTTAFPGYFAEIIIYDHVLSSMDRGAVVAYLTAKYPSIVGF